MELNFRQLTAEEIKPRATANNGGVKISLWKEPRANLAIIDDAVGGVANRSVTYSDDGKRCRIAIRMNGEWIVNDGCHFEGSPDNAPNDALNHAGFAWGIGTALYNSPNIFIYKDKLKNFDVEEGKPTCYDDFKVTEIIYGENCIESVTIAACEYGKPYATFTFKSEKAKAKPVQPKKEGGKAEEVADKGKTETPVSISREPVKIADSEVILIGNCRGKTYGEVKESETFKSFLEWAKKSNRVYSDARQAEQFKRFQEMAS